MDKRFRQRIHHTLCAPIPARRNCDLERGDLSDAHNDLR
jgi:hypothetical protein